MKSQANKHKNIPRHITIYCNLVFKKPIQKADGLVAGGEGTLFTGKGIYKFTPEFSSENVQNRIWSNIVKMLKKISCQFRNVVL